MENGVRNRKLISGSVIEPHRVRDGLLQGHNAPSVPMEPRASLRVGPACPPIRRSRAAADGIKPTCAQTGEEGTLSYHHTPHLLLHTLLPWQHRDLIAGYLIRSNSNEERSLEP